MNKVSGRIYSYDIMRFIAILAVIMIHTAGQFVVSSHQASFDFIISNILTSLSRFAVPVFTMISGSLMLNEKKELENKKIFRSAANFFFILIAWSVFFTIGYNVLKPMLFNEPFSLDKFLTTLFMGGHYHVWYLYMTVGLYLITPILRLFVKLKNKKLIKYYLILSVTACFVVPFVSSIADLFIDNEGIVLQYFKQFRLSFCTEYLTYYILGWYISNFEIKKSGRLLIYISGLIGLLLTVLSSHIVLINLGQTSNVFYNNNMLNIFCYSVAVFVFVYYLLKNKDLSKYSRLLVAQTKLSFGVYLIHGMFIFAFEFVATNVTNVLFKLIIIFIGSVVFSYASVYVMSKIPIVKMLVRG